MASMMSLRKKELNVCSGRTHDRDKVYDRSNPGISFHTHITIKVSVPGS